MLITLLTPLLVFSAWSSARRRGTPMPRWKERFGFLPVAPPSSKPRFWVHAVSVGEVLAVQSLLKQIKAQKPDAEILVSTGTTTGQATAQEQLGGLIDYLVYLPFDLPGACRRALKRVRPCAVIVAETELWLNFLAESKRAGAQTFVVNGRISDKSFKTAFKFRRFYSQVLRFCDHLLMQSDTDAERVKQLGAEAAKVSVEGNLKFDQALPEQTIDVNALRASLHLPPDGAVIVAGSTRVSQEQEPEEAIVLEAFKRIRQRFPDASLVIAPRHIERSEAVLKLASAHNLICARRTDLNPPPHLECLILDTFGELAQVYAIASVCIIGGGFYPLGGQNLFQPLAQGKPTFFGPFMSNFRDIAALAQKEGVGFSVPDADSLAAGVLELLEQPQKRKEIGEKAKQLIRSNTGASARCALKIIEACVKK